MSGVDGHDVHSNGTGRHQIDKTSPFLHPTLRLTRVYISNMQLSEMCRIQDDSAMAAELIQRCLYSIEAAFHSSFSLTSGKCRISYKNRENRGD